MNKKTQTQNYIKNGIFFFQLNFNVCVYNLILVCLKYEAFVLLVPSGH